MEHAKLQTLGRNFRSRLVRNKEQLDAAERNSATMHFVLAGLAVATAVLVWVVSQL